MFIEIVKSILLVTLFTFNLNAQFLSKKINMKIDFGIGSSTYQNIQSEQYLFFVNIPHLNGNYKNLSWDTDFNVELISETNKNTFLFGIVPLLRYDINFLNKNIFVRGGIGTNFINNHKISSRSTGSHFIFSDMLSIGISFFNGQNYSLELSYLFRHISNAGLFKRNQGFNSQYLLFSFII